MSAARARIARLAELLKPAGKVMVFAQAEGETEEQAVKRLPSARPIDTVILVRRFSTVGQFEPMTPN